MLIPATLPARTGRQIGRSAIIVGCDVRMPAPSRKLADAWHVRGSGRLALMDGAATLDEAVFNTLETGLHVPMTRPSEPMSGIDAADALASRRVRILVSQLSATHHPLRRDTAPTLVVTRARIVPSLASAGVRVVRQDRRPARR